MLKEFRSRWRRGVRTSIATKLSLNLVIILVLCGVLFTVVGVETISSLIVIEAEERVQNDLNTARLIYQANLDRLGQAAEFTASRTFIESILLEDVIDQSYIDELVRFKSNEGLDILNFTDDTGVVVFRTNNPGERGDDQSRQDLVMSVLRYKIPASGTVIISVEDLERENQLLVDQAYFEFIYTPMAITRAETEETSGMMQMAAVPVFGDRGDFIGIVYTGVMLNRNYSLVDEVKQTVFQGAVYEGKDIGTATIFQKDVRISTNVYNEDGSRAIGTRIAEDVFQEVVINGKQWIGRAYVVNDWYIAAYEPLRNIKDDIIGIMYVGILEQKYTDISNRAAWIFSGITLTGVVLAILVAILISRNLVKSIRELAIASNKLAKGNLDTTVSKSSNDELGDLADSFNLMAVALKERDDKLKEFTKKKIMESEKLALVGQLSANMAHELNNPMQGIVTYSYLLMENENCSEDSKANIQKIIVQANRCRDLIRGLLDFSRQKKPDKTLCEMNNLLKGCMSLIEKQAIFQNINIVWNLDPNLPRIILDPSQVERVFINLFVNAAEAMDGKGSLTITTSQNLEENMVEIKVQDTGHGITEENLAKIFDPFFTTKETGHGVGLGLAISYGIIKEHNGNVIVESELDQGTTFIISFPTKTSDTPITNG